MSKKRYKGSGGVLTYWRGGYVNEEVCRGVDEDGGQEQENTSLVLNILIPAFDMGALGRFQDRRLRLIRQIQR